MGKAVPFHEDTPDDPARDEVMREQAKKEKDAENTRIKLARRRAGGLLSQDTSGTLG